MNQPQRVGDRLRDSGFDVDGQVAIVTGCGRPNGLGYEIARELARRGARVVMSDLEDKGARNSHEPAEIHEKGLGLNGLAASLREQGMDVHPVLADVASIDGPTELISAAIERWGRLDILVNNAAAPQGEDRKPLDEVSDETLQFHVQVNLLGTFRMCRAAIPAMREQQYGRIINVSSIAAFRGSRHTALYSMTKAGIIGLTRSLAVEAAPHGITVNAISPGSIYTARSENSMRRAGVTDSARWLKVGDEIPAGRRGVPQDVAPAVVYLASRAASYVNAQNLTIDGGHLGF
ncbi:MAG: SDR family oxidoreductase [Hyphomicrobiales bacterium]|nr:MAG: SDR family oxidoreductase [Hyphomicrobiales bacterium]